MKLSSIVLVPALVLGVTVSVADAQWLTTDMTDYAPGETATLTGTDFAPGEAVVLQVRHIEAVPDTGADHQPWTVVADANGGFVTTWHVCEDDCIGQSLVAIAEGQSSGLHAATGFMDAGPFASTPRPELPVTNGQVNAIVESGNTVYIGGTFTFVGPHTGTWVPIDASSGLPVAGFPKVNREVLAVAGDGSGGWYIGGNFTNVGGLARNRLAHIDASNNVTAWNPDANSIVRALAVSGSTVYAGGDFSSVGGQPRNRIAALDATTGLVTAWNPNANGLVLALAVSGSTVYAGGGFGLIGGQPRSNIAALDATTGLVTTWNPGGASSIVRALAVSGSTVYAGGDFGFIGGLPRNRVAALDATTGLVTAWNPDADISVAALAVSGSTVYAGGFFTFIGGQPRNRIAALDATTGLVTAWNPDANSSVSALAVSGNTVYAGGFFTSVGGQPRNRIAALDATTGLVTAWNPNANNTVSALAVSGSTVYAGGTFTSVGGQPRNRIAALDATLNTNNATAWNPSANGSVTALAVSGSTVYAGGFFASIGGQPRNRIAALDATLNTSNATAWNPSANGQVSALAVSGSTVYAGGFFTSIGGQPRNRIAALDATLNTSNATAWNPDANNPVFALAVSGSIVYAGGGFSFIGSQPRNRIAALDATLNTSNATAWNPDANGAVTALAVSGSTVYVGGNFISIGGQPRNFIAELDATLNTNNATAWNPNALGQVFALAVSGSSVYAGGSFFGIGEEIRDGFAGFALACDTTAPVASITGPASGAVYAVGTAVSFTGSFTDNCCSPHTGTWTFDTLTQPATITEGAPGSATALYTFTAAGVYMVKLTVTDACGNSGVATQVGDVNAMVVIYDPDAGFVTGGGWIQSPPGAYGADPVLEGRANFGFVSKYKKGASVPTGETEFQYKLGDLNFHSTSYQWLVVSGARAQYKGTGTINGAGSYGFMLTALDGQISGGGGIDKFRMKITDGSGALVYDNMLGAPESDQPSTVLGGGSIVIHTGGNGSTAMAGEAREEGGGLMRVSLSTPGEYQLAQNVPNPFARGTMIPFSLPQRSRVSFLVFDLAGREVCALADGEWEAGRHSATMASTGRGGAALVPGVYFVRMKAQSLESGRSFTAFRKMVLAK